MKISCTLSGYVVAGCLVVGTVASAQSPAGTPPSAKPQANTPVAAKDAPVNADAVALADFKKRIDAYATLHRKVAKDTPALKQTNDPAEITRAQEGLATAIRSARADAKPGDIFTPEVRTVLRKVLRPELKGEDGKDAKAVLKDDAPTAVPLKVNANYPELATRPTTPAAVLKNLPTLPDEVEFRFFKTHLLLIDTRAGIIVDYMANAIAE